MPLDAVTLLRRQAGFVNDIMTQVFAGVTAEQAVWRLDGSSANPIVSTFLHAYATEDRATHLQQKETMLFASGGWQQRLGFDPSAPWSAATIVDLDAARAYAAEVHAYSRQYLDVIDPTLLEQEVDTPRGRQQLITTLSLVMVIHKLTHMGEIAALLGCQGAKGFPF